MVVILMASTVIPGVLSDSVFDSPAEVAEFVNTRIEGSQVRTEQYRRENCEF